MHCQDVHTAWHCKQIAASAMPTGDQREFFHRESDTFSAVPKAVTLQTNSRSSKNS